MQNKNEKRGIIMIGKIISLFLFFSLFTILPFILKQLWGPLMFISQKIGQTNIWMLIIVLLSANISSLLVHNLFLWYVYTAKKPFFEQFRVNPNKNWPWEEDGKVSWNSKIRGTLLSVTVNSVGISVLLLRFLAVRFQNRFLYTVEDWPTPYIIFKHFTFFFIYNQIVSYLTHRALHHHWLYFLHKKHHEYYTSIGLTATYASPFEYIFSNLLSTAVCVPILMAHTNVHLVSAFIWIYFRLAESIQIHSGYSFPWDCMTFCPLKNDSTFHDYHHSHNEGTFGSMFTVMDQIFGTDKGYKKYVKKD